MLPKRHTIAGNQLKFKWDLDIHRFSYLILKHDIAVLDPSEIPTVKFNFDPNPYKLDLTELLNIIQNDPNILNEKLFWLPELEKLGIEKEISSLKSKVTSEFPYLRFRRGDQSQTPAQKSRKSAKVSKSEAPSQIEKKIPENRIKDVIEEHEGEIKQHPNVFSLIGKVWFVKFNQQEWGLYPDQKKYKYLAHLLNLSADIGINDNPEVSISNLDLDYCVNPMPYLKDKSKYAEGSRDELDFNEDFSNEEKRLTKKTLKKLLDRIELAKDYDDDDKMLNLAKEEFYEYVRHLKQRGVFPVIKGGGTIINLKPQKRLNEKSEKIRQRIKNNIKNAIQDFKDKMPDFVDHLEYFCKTKLTETVYHPIPSTSWFVSF